MSVINLVRVLLIEQVDWAAPHHVKFMGKMMYYGFMCQLHGSLLLKCYKILNQDKQSGIFITTNFIRKTFVKLFFFAIHDSIKTQLKQRYNPFLLLS